MQGAFQLAAVSAQINTPIALKSIRVLEITMDTANALSKINSETIFDFKESLKYRKNV